MASAVKRLCSESLICSYARPIQPKSYVRRRWCRSVSTTLARPRLPFDDSNRRLQNRSNGGSTELDSRQAISGGRLMSSYKRRGGVSSPQPWEDNRGLEFVPDNEMDDIEEEEPEDKSKLGFWAEGEEEMGPDEEFHGDDISSLGHGELERHRELREYARIAAWELPLLSNLAKPFEPPQKNQVLRFRYTTYLGEQHAAANKVVVEFCPSDIPDLSPQQQAKLIKLCGTRYNPSTEIVKMSCEMFDSQMQNRRYLSDVANALVKEAKDPADTFEDVPFDFRHHKPKQRFEFPEEWLLTPERKRQLEMRRNESLDQDRKRIQQGTVVDGRAAIESSAGAARALEPEMVLASPTQRPTQRRAR